MTGARFSGGGMSETRAKLLIVAFYLSVSRPLFSKLASSSF